MQAVCNSVKSEIPSTHPLAGVPVGSRAENTEGLGHHVSLGPPAVILHQRGSIGESQRVLTQDDNKDVRAVRNQIKKARGIWARVGQVLQADNTPLKVSTKFYKAVVQLVLLYGSKSWNLITTTLMQLEESHI